MWLVADAIHHTRVDYNTVLHSLCPCLYVCKCVEGLHVYHRLYSTVQYSAVARLRGASGVDWLEGRGLWACAPRSEPRGRCVGNVILRVSSEGRPRHVAG